MKKPAVRLDHSRLFGFKIVSTATRSVGAKIGGGKGGPVAAPIASKIGNKVGVKV